MTDKILVHVTCPTREMADSIAAELVAKRLAACVSIAAPLTSVYRWRGAIERSEEHALTIKTRRDLFPLVCATVRQLHTYEIPEIIASPLIDGASDYLDWIDEELVPRDA